MRTIAFLSSAAIFLLTTLAANLPFTARCPALPIDQDADIYYNKGLALFFDDSMEAAETALRTSIAYQPHFARAHFYLAEVYVRQGNNKAALDEYQKTIELDRESYHALYRCASLLATLHKYDQAIQVLQKAVTVHPYYQEAYEKLATLYIEIGDFKSAETIHRILKHLEDF